MKGLNKFLINDNKLVMNKKEFVKRVSNSCNISQSKCEEILNCCYKVICNSLKVGESVVFKGFGKFFVKRKKERVVKNIYTKNLTFINQKNVVSFKISNAFKSIVK